MHYQKLTSIRTGGGRFLCIPIQPQQACVAPQGIICRPVQTPAIRASHSPFCPSVLCGEPEAEQCDSVKSVVITFTTGTIRQWEWSGFSLASVSVHVSMASPSFTTAVDCHLQGDRDLLGKSSRYHTSEIVQDDRNEEGNSLLFSKTC